MSALNRAISFAGFGLGGSGSFFGSTLGGGGGFGGSTGFGGTGLGSALGGGGAGVGTGSINTASMEGGGCIFFWNRTLTNSSANNSACRPNASRRYRGLSSMLLLRLRVLRFGYEPDLLDAGLLQQSHCMRNFTVGNLGVSLHQHHRIGLGL